MKRTPERTYRRGVALLLLLSLALLSVLGAWARVNWSDHLATAQTDLQRLAAVNSLPVALAVRDARRTVETLDLAFAAMPAASAREVHQLLEAELALRAVFGEMADVFQSGSFVPLGSTAQDGFDPATWAPQMARVTRTRQLTMGWAYHRRDAWWLPLFFLREDGRVLVISLSVDAAVGQWLKPALPGENPVGLRAADDRVLLRHPFTPAMLGADARSADSSRQMNEARALGASAGSVRAVATETDSIERLIGWFDVSGTDLRMLVAASVDNVFAQWRAREAPKFLAMAALIVLAMGGAALALRQQYRLGARERQALVQAEQAQAMTRAALAGSRDITWQQLPGGELLFGEPLGPLMGAPAASNVEGQCSLPWLMACVEAAGRSRVEQALLAAQQRDASVHVNFSARGFDQQTRHLVLNGRHVAGGGEQPSMLAGTLRDVTTQVRATEQLRETAATLERMCALARIGPWQVDVASGMLQMSPVARALYGLTPDAALPLWQDFHPADAATRARVQVARGRLLRDGVGYEMVLPAHLPDGSRRWLRSVAAAHFVDGVLTRVDGAAQDVTEEVVAREAANLQNARTRLLAEAVAGSSQLMLVTDAQQRITWCNDTFTRRTGYTLEEARGQRPGQLLQRGTVPQAIRQLISRHIATRDPFHGIRVQNFSKSGQPYWVDLEVRPIFDAHGELEAYLGLQTDVTHDIEREQALRESTQRFELATAHAGLGVYEVDLVRQARSWSDSVYVLYGFDPAQGLPDIDAVDARVLPEDRGLRQESFTQAAADPELREWSAEFRIRRPDGSLAWLHSRCLIDRDASGLALRALGTLLDVTHAHTVQAERQARFEAEARNQAKTTFLSRMSHELRTPLHAVIGYAQLVNSEADTLPVALQAHVRHIEAAGWHLLALIDDVLELARIESDVVTIGLEPVALDVVAREAVTIVSPLLAKLSLQIEVSTRPVVVLANPTRIRQVLVNLLSNAAKYNVFEGRVRVTSWTEGQQACLEVADTGVGMNESQLASLFEPFNRLGRERTDVEGTGIGLAITKGLVELMGGTLQVSSEVEKGSRFTLRFPLSSAEVPAPAPAARLAALQRKEMAPREVLCLEDNEVNALLLRHLLQMLRPTWKLRVAGTGAQATDMLCEGPATLVFLDLNLPDVNGLDWLGAARASGLLLRADVVLLTADVMPGTRARAELAGLRDFLPKPFLLADFEILLDRLDATGAPQGATAANG